MMSTEVQPTPEASQVGNTTSGQEVRQKATKVAIKEAKEEMEAIVPNTEVKTWTLGKGENAYECTQRPLSYFAKMEWFALLAEAIDKMMQDGATVTDILSQMGGVSDVANRQLQLGDFENADTFLRAMAKLVQYAPDFMEDSYCMWLGVPRGDREYVKSVMRQPEEDGGLSDDQGFEIIERFLDQNIGAIESFFMERLPRLGKRAQSLLNRKQSQERKSAS
jgi:hypothetical protein